MREQKHALHSGDFRGGAVDVLRDGTAAFVLVDLRMTGMNNIRIHISRTQQLRLQVIMGSRNSLKRGIADVAAAEPADPGVAPDLLSQMIGLGYHRVHLFVDVNGFVANAEPAPFSISAQQRPQAQGNLTNPPIFRLPVLQSTTA